MHVGIYRVRILDFDIIYQKWTLPLNLLDTTHWRLFNCRGDCREIKIHDTIMERKSPGTYYQYIESATVMHRNQYVTM